MHGNRMEMACNEIKTRYNDRHAMFGGIFDVVPDAVICSIPTILLLQFF